MKPALGATFGRAWRRLLFRFRRGRLQREVAAEMELHRQLKQEENERGGMQRPEATLLSRRQFGNTTFAQEECREMWSFMTTERLAQDLRYGIRTFARTPMFTAIAVGSLALGIGSNTAMFSLVDALLLRPLPYRHPETLVRVTGIFPRAGLAFLRERSRTMDIAAASNGTELNLTGTEHPERVVASYTSPNLFSVLGVTPSRGRSFQESEDRPGNDGVAIISDVLWKTTYSSDPGVVGRVIKLDGVNREIVGVMPSGFSYPSARVRVWIPMRLEPANFLEYWAGEFVPVTGRLRRGASDATAQTEMRALISEFRKTFPYPMARDWNADSAVIPLQEDLVGSIRGKLMILLASVAIVLLIACTNVANLLLSRATTRRKEMALRAALGAGRFRIIRQLLTESIGLALAGGIAGLALGISALSLFKALLPASTPGLAEVNVNWEVVGAITLVTLLTGLGFGLAPALNASQIDLAMTMKTGSQRSTSGIWVRLRSILIGMEVGMTLVLVVSAGLLVKSLYYLSRGNPGFDVAQVTTIRISPNQASCDRRSTCIALYEKLLREAREMEGVREAAMANTVPLDGNVPTIPVDIEGHPKTADHPAPMMWFNAVSPDYLHVLNVPLLAGRNLSRADSANANPVASVSAAMAKQFWPRETAIGKHIKPTGSKAWRTIVGVVADVHHYSLSKALPVWVHGSVYMPYAQAETEDGSIPATMTLLVKSHVDPAMLSARLHQLAQSLDPNAPVGQAVSLETLMTHSIADFSSTIRVFLSFATGAMLLAAMGIYGLTSYWVTQRTYEIGLRVAIGASRRRITAMILKQGLTVSFYGVIGGVAASLLLTRFLASLLYGVGANDAMTFIAVIALVLGVACLATAVPAWRASRIDPVKSLRAE